MLSRGSERALAPQKGVIMIDKYRNTWIGRQINTWIDK
jgi:hypothetical protein